MASNAASVRLTVAQRQALAALNQFQSKFASMTKSMAGNTRRQATEAQKTNKTLQKWGSSIKGAALSMVGFGSATGAAYTVMSLVRNEIETIEKTMGRMKDRQMDYGTSAMKLAFALPKPDGKLIDMSFDEITKKFSSGTNDPGQALRLFHYVHSANADLSLSKKADITEELMNRRWDLDEDAKKAAGVAITDSHAKQLGRGFDSTITGQMGLMEGGKAASKVVDDRAYYSNVATMGLDLAKFGVNQGESLLLGSSLTSAAVDPTGEESRTALIKFFSTLEETKGQFGVKEEGMALLRAMREGKSDKHLAFRKHLLGAFDKEEGDDYTEMTPAEARLKLEGRSKMKFYLMDLLRARTEEPESLLNIMHKVKEQGQIPLHYIGGTFQVAMQETFKQAAAQFESQYSGAMGNKFVKLTAEQNKYDKTNAALEMKDTHGARQKIRKDAALRLMENSGVPMAGFRNQLDFLMNKYGSEQGMLKALKESRRQIIYQHPDKGQLGIPMMPSGMMLSAAESIFGEDVDNMTTERMKDLTYYDKGFFYNDNPQQTSIQQIQMVESIDELIKTIKSDLAERLRANKVTKVEVTNAGAINEPTGAKKLGK